MRTKSDDKIKQSVLDQIRWQPGVSSNDIGVTVHQGSVALFGHVGSLVEKVEAIKAAWRVRGVKTVADEIGVRTPDSVKHDDADIAERLSRVFEWNVAVPENSVTATVRHGHVTLRGEVEWNFQREAAEKCATMAGPLSSVTNKIKIRPKGTSRNIEKSITDALRRYAKVNAERISVGVEDGTVTLTGTVDTFYQRKIVDRAAWSAQGVTEVRNFLQVAHDTPCVPTALAG